MGSPVRWSGLFVANEGAPLQRVPERRAPTPTPAGRALRNRLRGLLAELRALSPGAYDAADSRALVRLACGVGDVLSRVLDFVVELCRRYEVGSVESPEHAALAAAARSFGPAVQRHLDAALQLEGPEEARWQLLYFATEVLREGTRRLVELEERLCAVEGLEGRPEPAVSETERLLAARWSVLRLRAQLGRTPGDSAGVSERLLAFSDALAEFAGRDAYLSLSITQRRELGALQQQLRAFARATSSSAATLLWEHCVALFPLLLSVNDRPELLCHDRGALTRAHEQLLAGVDTRQVAQELHLVRGRSQRLDEVLDGPLADHRNALASSLDEALALLGRSSSCASGERARASRESSSATVTMARLTAVSEEQQG